MNFTIARLIASLSASLRSRPSCTTREFSPRGLLPAVEFADTHAHEGADLLDHAGCSMIFALICATRPSRRLVPRIGNQPLGRHESGLQAGMTAVSGAYQRRDAFARRFRRPTLDPENNTKSTLRILGGIIGPVSAPDGYRRAGFEPSSSRFIAPDARPARAKVTIPRRPSPAPPHILRNAAVPQSQYASCFSLLRELASWPAREKYPSRECFVSPLPIRLS